MLSTNYSTNNCNFTLYLIITGIIYLHLLHQSSYQIVVQRILFDEHSQTYQKETEEKDC